jgi:hypothetical protein
MAKNIEFSAEEMSELHAFYTMEMEKAELRLKAIKSIIAKIGSTPQKSVSKPKTRNNSTSLLDSELLESKQVKVPGRKPGRPAKVKTLDTEPKIAKRRGRPTKVKSDSVTLDLITTDVISAPKKRGPKPGTKYKKTAGKKTKTAKTPKLKVSKSELNKSVSDVSNVSASATSVSPKKRGPKPGTKYKKTAGQKTRVAKAPKLKVVKPTKTQSVSEVSNVSTAKTLDSSKKRGPKPGAKYNKRSVETKPLNETKTISTPAKKEKAVSKITKRSSSPKTSKKVTVSNSSNIVSDTVVSKPVEIENKIKALKSSVAKLVKPKAVKVAKVAKSVEVKSTKPKAVKVNSLVKKSPVVKVKATANAVSNEAPKEPQA